MTAPCPKTTRPLLSLSAISQRADHESTLRKLLELCADRSTHRQASDGSTDILVRHEGGELWRQHLSPGAATHNQTVHGIIPAEEDLTLPSGRPGMLCVLHLMTFGSTERMEEQWFQSSIVALILQVLDKH